MSFALGQVAPATAFWASGLLRVLPAIRRPQQRWLCAALLAFALGLTFDVPAVYVHFDNLVHVPNLANLVEHTFAILGVFALLTVLRDISAGQDHTSWLRVRGLLLVIAMVASAVFFVAAPVSTEAVNFTARYGGVPQIAAYWSITIGYFGVSLFELANLVLRHSRQSRRASLRIGFLLVGVGVLLGVLYSALKIIELAADARAAGTSRSGVADRLDAVVLACGAALIGIGLLLPAIASTRTAVEANLSQRLALLQLRPLWRDLTADVPHVVLGNSPSLLRDLLKRDPRLRLYRRVIEVRDAGLALQLFAPISIGSANADMPQSHDDAARRDAVRLRGALAARRAGAAPDPTLPPLALGSGDVAGELENLRALARAWRAADGPASATYGAKGRAPTSGGNAA